jgi:enolase
VSIISKVHARQVFDSRGNPTIEAEVFSKNISSTAICPSGASTGTYEAYEKRDIKNKKYLGKSVFAAIKLVNSKISKKLKNKNLHDQELIDSLLIKLDGTKQKSNLGANAILAVSIAVKKLSAKIKKIPLYKTFLLKNNFKLPYPLMNIINGGVHANNGLRIQEFMIRPDKAKSFSEAMRMCFLIIQNLKTLIKRNKLSTSVGDEGGFAPMISSNEKALDLIVNAINKSGFKNGKDVSICLDVAANELFKRGTYLNAYYSIHSKKFISVDETIKKYLKIINKYHIKSIEDPFSESDWTAWSKIMRSVNNVQIVGDDLYVTNLERLKRGFLNHCSNAILIKLNQIGTVSETLDVIKCAQMFGYKTIISHRSGDSEDTFISDLAVGTNSNQIKTGSLARSERVAKYNQLIRIEEDLGKKAKMNKIH